MFSKKTLLGIGLAGAMALGAGTAVEAAVVNSYFGMNFVDSYGSVSEVELMSITYYNGSGTFTVAMPAFPGVSSYSGQPYVGLPDGNDNQYSGGPTYTTATGGNGETTRTVGVTVPIDWNMTNPAVPTVDIVSMDVKAVGAVWTVAPTYYDNTLTYSYTVGLIPVNPFGYNELSSAPGSAPQGDIYGAGTGYDNPVGIFVVTSVDNSGYQNLVGTAFGQFRFAAAAPVPIPAAAWLFGSGLLGLIGVARRKAGRRAQ